MTNKNVNCRIEVKDMNYYYISVIIFAAFVIFAAGTIASLSIEAFNTVITVKRQKNKAFYQITLLAHIIEIQIHLLLLCFQAVCIIQMYNSIAGGNYDMGLMTEILINIGCSIATSAILTVIVYFKFLKHIPEETKKSIDDLLNSRLGYETTNHNANLENTNIAKESLSREHSEIKQNISTVNNNIFTVSKDVIRIKDEIRTDRKLKDLQYNYLNENDKTVIESINKIKVLGDSLQKVNYENQLLKAENEKLKLENEQLNNTLSMNQKRTNKFTQHM